VDAICRRRGYRRAADRQCIEEDIKLQYHFGGQDVAYLPTVHGLMIVAAGSMQSDAFASALAALDPAERRHVTLYSPDVWNDATSSLLTPSNDEA
jgi:hypothetical protein